jgi:acyl carrier protein
MAGAEERRRLLLGFLSAQVAKALRIPAEQIDMDEPLSDLGLESLMAVDVAAHVRAKAGFELTALSLVGGDTLRQIANAMALAIGRTRTTANEPSVRETDAFDDASSTKGQRDDGIDE